MVVALRHVATGHGARMVRAVRFTAAGLITVDAAGEAGLGRGGAIPPLFIGGVMFRQNTYQEGSFYQLNCLSRQSVVPGQSVSIDLQSSWETAAFTRNVLNGGLASIMAFYVPYRLVWDEWTEFISDPQSTAVVPMATVPMRSLFEVSTAGQPTNVFARRAMKLIYNQYFGSDQFGTPGQFYYQDIEDDADTLFKQLRTNDQFLGKLMQQNSAPDDDFEADVSGTAPNMIASIPLNEFRQAMKDAHSSRRSGLTGDKYVDAMRRMGVQLDWKIQNAPEFLGSVSADFDAKETRATYTPADPPPAGASQTGRSYARFNERMRLSTRRKFFAEHGIILTFLVIRPFVFNTNLPGPWDCFVQRRENFYLGDNQTGVNETTAARLGVTGSDWYMPRFAWLRAGQNLTGRQSTAPWIVTNTPTDVQSQIWPTVSVPQDPVLTYDFASYTRYRSSGPTPVRSTPT